MQVDGAALLLNVVDGLIKPTCIDSGAGGADQRAALTMSSALTPQIAAAALGEISRIVRNSAKPAVCSAMNFSSPSLPRQHRQYRGIENHVAAGG
ncbi:MAG: hypothetical protein IPO38_06220 [Rhodocyclaceae bacterium]|nr:hypothetical protein [Rhodocyclaceae bacterium]